MIKINKNIIEFDYYKDGEKLGEFAVKKHLKNKEFISKKFPFKQIVGFYDGDNYFKMDLLGNSENTIVANLSWRYFSNEVLKVFSNKFSIELYEIAQNKYSLTYGENKTILNIAIKNLEDNYFIFSIFYIHLPDLYRGAGKFEGELYIHGIWQVELSKEFKKIIKETLLNH